MFLSVTEVSYASSQTVLNKANLDMKAGRYSVALESLRQLVSKDKNDYQAWFLLGVAYTHGQYYHQAIEAFRQVIVLRPDLAEPHNNLAAIYSALDDPEAAARELEQALVKRPDFMTAEENLADLYIKLALKHYRNSVKKEPNPVVKQRYIRLLKALKPVKDKTKPTKVVVSHPKPQAVATADAKAEKSSRHKIMATTDKPRVMAIKHITPEENGDESITSVLDTLETWRLAWSNQDVDAYFSAYAADFKPPSRFSSLKSWKKYKRQVIRNKKFIRVNFEQVKVDVRPDRNLASVMLLQHFHSNSYNGDDFKKITMKYEDDNWKITGEATVK